MLYPSRLSRLCHCVGFTFHFHDGDRHTPPAVKNNSGGGGHAGALVSRGYCHSTPSRLPRKAHMSRKGRAPWAPAARAVVLAGSPKQDWVRTVPKALTVRTRLRFLPRGNQSGSRKTIYLGAAVSYGTELPATSIPPQQCHLSSC